MMAIFKRRENGLEIMAAIFKRREIELKIMATIFKHWESELETKAAILKLKVYHHLQLIFYNDWLRRFLNDCAVKLEYFPIL